MRRRLLAASVASITVVSLGVPVGPSSAQTPSTVFVGVVTVTSPPVSPVPAVPNLAVPGPRRTVSCRSYYRGHGKRRHVVKRVCRKRRVSVVSSVSSVSTRRTVATVSHPQPTLAVAPPPATFVVSPPPPTLAVAPPPTFVVNVAATRVEQRSDDDHHENQRRQRASKGKGKEQSKSKGKARSHND